MMRGRVGFDRAKAARLAGIGGLLLFLSWQRVQATRIGYRVETARKQARALRGRVAELKVGLDERLSPEAVAAQAREKLGMSPAAPDSLRRLYARPDALGGLLARLRAAAPFVAAARS